MFKKAVHKCSLIAGLVTLSLSAHAQDFCIEGSGNITEQEVALVDFTNISNDTVAKLVVTQDDITSVRVKVDDNIHQHLDLIVENDTLAINFKREDDFSCFINVSLEVHVSQADYKKLFNTASGTISAANNLQLDTLEVHSKGSGDISLKGQIDEQTVILDGSGSIYSFDISSQQVNATNNGSGDIEITATNTLTATLRGSGNILYKGNPPNKFTDVFGSGQLFDISGVDNGGNNNGNLHSGDFDNDGDIDRKDVRKFRRALRAGQSFDLNYDFNFDDIVNRRDVRALTQQCTFTKCRGKAVNTSE